VKYNERTGTKYNFLTYPTDIVIQAVRWYIRYRLSYANLSEILSERGFEITDETLRLWVKIVAPEMTSALRKWRKNSCGESWYVDETYIKIKGKWRYVYRAIDRKGTLVDCMVSAKREMNAARRFFKRPVSVTDVVPDRVTTDGHNSYPNARIW
jgi:putative transposase